MYVRLAFAVAAFWSRNFNYCDEVLAVGDASSRKAIGKMQDISKQDGKNSIVVGHMTAVRSFVQGIVLEENGLISNGSIEQALDIYNSQNELIESKICWTSSNAGNEKAIIKD
jgi:lipopolysaccharide transport system ATP-binding protein